MTSPSGSATSSAAVGPPRARWAAAPRSRASSTSASATAPRCSTTNCAPAICTPRSPGSALRASPTGVRRSPSSRSRASGMREVSCDPRPRLPRSPRDARGHRPRRGLDLRGCVRGRSARRVLRGDPKHRGPKVSVRRTMNMKIHGVRMGLATNSSSSHSLIFLPDAADRDVSSAEFGWSHFTAASTKARRDYLALTLHSALCAAVGEDIAELVTAAWGGQSAPKDGSVDHQSQYVMPQRWDGRCIDKDFFDDFSAFMLQKGLVILGGNDNDDGHEQPLADGTEFTLPLPRDEHGAAYVARKDGTYWAVFNRKNGTKIRFSFERDAAPPMRATLPELVDVKITDLCTRGCLFCYQDSTPRGEHASRGVLDVLACALGQARVFEVAIGGGEPTAH